MKSESPGGGGGGEVSLETLKEEIASCHRRIDARRDSLRGKYAACVADERDVCALFDELDRLRERYICKLKESQLPQPFFGIQQKQFLNVMVVGLSGTGKSTLIRQFLLQSGKPDSTKPGGPLVSTALLSKLTDAVDTSTINPEEFDAIVETNSGPLYLHITDMPGIGTADIEEDMKHVFSTLMGAWQRQKDERFHPTNNDAIHLYHLVLCVTSTHRFTGIDRKLLKVVEQFCPVAVVITKADCYLETELSKMIDMITRQLESEHIQSKGIFPVVGHNREMKRKIGQHIYYRPWHESADWLDGNLKLKELFSSGLTGVVTEAKDKYTAWLTGGVQPTDMFIPPSNNTQGGTPQQKKRSCCKYICYFLVGLPLVAVAVLAYFYLDL
eukprot:TRINITY_DN920_c0_g2_i2.p1 TRINITY_DN920_c0_g2~~TRINITY_DN920_c0_g2_i2.p1  ORF type:complete len:405 (+),score=94.60 TRINITY_DN920_c0_g2_i2:62-1216(+)